VVNGEFVRYGVDEAAYSTDVLTDHLIEAIEAAPSDQPFFAVYAPLAPHFRRGKNFAVPAPRHAGTITDLHRPANYDSCRFRTECPVAGSALRQDKLTGTERSIIDKGYQTASETLLAVDEAFQDIISTLSELGRLDDTVLIFTSDNGFMYGEHGIPKGKIVPTRESLFVPLFISGPGFSPGVETAPVSNIDLAPTLVDLLDAAATAPMDGVSLLDPPDPHRALLVESKLGNGGGYVGTFADGWMFIDWNSIRRNDLYGPDDPLQIETLDNDPQWADAQAELDRVTDELTTCSGAACASITWSSP
jgi:arylsulfatase A-like enzyme